MFKDSLEKLTAEVTQLTQFIQTTWPVEAAG